MRQRCKARRSARQKSYSRKRQERTKQTASSGIPRILARQRQYHDDDGREITLSGERFRDGMLDELAVLQWLRQGCGSCHDNSLMLDSINA